jgi:hypothetical protein
MKITLIDERDINIELPLPTFRVAVWHTPWEVSSFDVTDGSIYEVLSYAERQSENATTVEVFALMTTQAHEKVRILLHTFDAPLPGGNEVATTL